jgi:hypothetical protein
VGAALIDNVLDKAINGSEPRLTRDHDIDILPLMLISSFLNQSNPPCEIVI